MNLTTPALVFCFFTAVVVLFQLGLTLGFPWGAASMGGKFPGIYPPKMRVVALVNICLLLFLSLIVLVRSNILDSNFFEMSKIAIWFVVVFYALGTLLNAITPSKIERIWAPVCAIQLFCAVLIIALR